jgi:hypothetical protein
MVLMYDTRTSVAQCEFWKSILFCVDEFRRGVNITNFKEKLIYNLKAKLKILNTKEKIVNTYITTTWIPYAIQITIF